MKNWIWTLPLTFSSALSLPTSAKDVGQASFRVCTREACVAVDAAQAFESSNDQSMTFYSGNVSFFDRKTQKLLRRSTEEKITWKPQLGQLWITSADGELNIYDFKTKD